MLLVTRQKTRAYLKNETNYTQTFCPRKEYNTIKGIWITQVHLKKWPLKWRGWCYQKCLERDVKKLSQYILHIKYETMKHFLTAASIASGTLITLPWHVLYISLCADLQLVIANIDQFIILSQLYKHSNNYTSMHCIYYYYYTCLPASFPGRYKLVPERHTPPRSPSSSSTS